MSYDHANPAHAGQLHHIELYASDLDTSVDFWDWLLCELGYELKNEWDGGRSWINGPMYIVLVQANASDHLFDRQTAGLNHLAFHATTREQVDVTHGGRPHT
jgi:catechol 2,3-dioxygenase-like lactoylglutathione lyase family enzyme